MDKLPPQNLDIEKACLSCALLNKDARQELFDRTAEEDFYYDKHRLFFKCIKEINSSEFNIIKDWYIINNLEITMEWYMEVYESATSSAEITRYINKLLEYSNKRKVIARNQDAIDRAYRGDASEEIIDDLTKKLKDIEYDDSTVKSLTDVMGSDLNEIQVEEGDYLTTGLMQLDVKMTGIFEELFIVAARPSMGKTALVLNIAQHIAENHDVDFYSLEQPAKDLVIRLLCAETNIEFKRLKIKGRIDLMESAKVQEAYDKIRKLKLHIDDQPKKPSQIIRATRQRKPRIIMTDYLQLLIPDDKSIQRHLQIQEMTRSFKNLLKETGIPHILLCQLSRANEKRVDKRPILSDLREGGDIEQDADGVLFIHREINAENAELILAKSRNGPTGVVDATFNGQSMQFF